ncbi:MAG: prepilin-type N-terminal cleavage/methylation domain-containing protein [Synergistaceae bacterium]|nr:prepilin-type N-terminal cleavage/methylation domain-containing protein [Synergistaceae bacterium]
MVWPFMRPARADNKHSAFTLVELLIVIIIIGVLSCLIIVGAEAVIEQSRAARCLNDRKILEREFAIAKANDPNFFDTYDATKIFKGKNQDEICLSGGHCSWALRDSERAIDILCNKHPDYSSFKEFKIGDTYEVGDLMYSHGFVFECIRANTTGTTSRTRDPSLRSNKSTWKVIGFVGDVLEYSSTVRYEVGMKIPYKGNIYIRKDFNLVGGQVPEYDPPRDSDYWTYVGPATSP